MHHLFVPLLVYSPTNGKISHQPISPLPSDRQSPFYRQHPSASYLQTSALAVFVPQAPMLYFVPTWTQTSSASWAGGGPTKCFVTCTYKQPQSCRTSAETCYAAARSPSYRIKWSPSIWCDDFPPFPSLVAVAVTAQIFGTVDLVLGFGAC